VAQPQGDGHLKQGVQLPERDVQPWQQDVQVSPQGVSLPPQEGQPHDPHPQPQPPGWAGIAIPLDESVVFSSSAKTLPGCGATGGCCASSRPRAKTNSEPPIAASSNVF
jgi:hypothetical protein